MKQEWEGIDYNTERMEVSGGWLYRTTSHSGLALAFVPEPNTTFRYHEAVGPVSATWQISTPVAPDPKLEVIATAALRVKDMFEEFGKSAADLKTPELQRLFEAVDNWLDEPEESENDD